MMSMLLRRLEQGNLEYIDRYTKSARVRNKRVSLVFSVTDRHKDIESLELCSNATSTLTKPRGVHEK